MTRILLHPGFHKCATSSAQDFLHENRERIWPTTAIARPDRLRDLSMIVFRYEDSRDPELLETLTEAMRGLLRDIHLTPKRNLILSCENLLGRMPQCAEGAPYPVAVPVLRALTSAFDVIDGPHDLTVYLSTRDQDDWLRSVWGHLARKRRGVRITDDLPAFRARFSGVSLTDQVAQIREELPALDIRAEDIDALADAPFGVGQPFLDMMRLPPEKRAACTPPKHSHRGPELALATKLIELNRSDLGPDALHAAKDRLIETHAEAHATPVENEDEQA